MTNKRCLVQIILIFLLFFFKSTAQNQQQDPSTNVESPHIDLSLPNSVLQDKIIKDERILEIDIPSFKSRVDQIKVLEAPYKLNIDSCSQCSSPSTDACNDQLKCQCKSSPSFYGNDCSIDEATFGKIKELKIQVLNELAVMKDSYSAENVEDIIDLLCQLSQNSQTLILTTVEKIHEITNACVKLSTQRNFNKVTKLIDQIIQNLLKYHGAQQLREVCRTSKQFLRHISSFTNDSEVIELKQKNLTIRVGSIDAINSKIQNQTGHTIETKVNHKILEEVKLADGSAVTAQSVRIGNIQYFLDIESSDSDLKTSMYTIKFFNNGKSIKVKNLTHEAEVEIKFKISSSQYFSQIKKLIYDTVPLNSIEELNRRKEQILREKPIAIKYYSRRQGGWLSDGVRFMDITEEYVIAKTSHLTDFAGFIGESIQVLQASNLGVFEKMVNLSSQDFVGNIGFQIIAMLWVLYIVVLLMLSVLEKQQRNKISRLDTRKDLMQKRTFQFEREITANLEGQSPIKKLKLKLQAQDDQNDTVGSPSTRSEREDKFDSERIIQDDSQKKITRPSLKSLFNPRKNSVSTFKSMAASKQAQTQTAENNTISQPDSFKCVSRKLSKQKSEKTPESKWRKVGIIAKAINRLESTQVKGSFRRTLGKSIYSEIKHNNMLINLFIKQSVVFPRAARTTVFFMAMILQVFLVALFYQIQEGPQISTKKQLIQNFWIGFWSVFLSILPILITACMFTMPKKRRNLIVGTQNEDDFDKQLKKQTRSMRFRYILAYTISFCAMIFTSWYVTAFGAWVGELQSNEFLASSLIAIFIDGIIMEISAALAVGIVVTMVFKWKFMKFLYCIPITIEIYRMYRNMSGD